MVMIDLGDEKKSLGVISVTRVTESSRRGSVPEAVLAESWQVRDQRAEIVTDGRQPGAG
jgi:hypothetical protein